MDRLIAHRGWSGKAPENTLPAVILALEEPRIDCLEIDVHLTKDGIPVVIHDFTVDRTTDGKGAVKDLTLAELKALDAGSWFGERFAGERIPTLDEVLALTKGRKRLFIELKQAAGRYRGLERKVIDVIKAHRAEEWCRLISFDHKSLEMCLRIEPDIERTLVLHGSPLLLTEQVDAVRASSVSMYHEYVDQLTADSLLTNGTELVVWTVDQKEVAERLTAFCPDIAFTTNHPDRLWQETRGEEMFV